MNKLITYLKQGNGHGLKAVLIFTLLISFLLWGIIYAFVRKIPDNSALNDFIHQLPTVVIQDGIVVEPANANTTYSVQGQPLFYLQTDRDEVPPFASDGVYLTRKMFAFVAQGQVQQGAFLSGNATITSEVLMHLVRSFVVWFPVILGITYFLILWIFYLFVVGISAFFSWIFGLIFQFRFPKESIWRSASFATIAVLSIDIIMSLFGYSIGRITYPMLSQLITTILLVLLIVFGLREKQEEKKTQKTIKQHKK